MNGVNHNPQYPISSLTTLMERNALAKAAELRRRHPDYNPNVDQAYFFAVRNILASFLVDPDSRLAQESDMIDLLNGVEADMKPHVMGILGSELATESMRQVGGNQFEAAREMRGMAERILQTSLDIHIANYCETLLDKDGENSVRRVLKICAHMEIPTLSDLSEGAIIKVRQYYSELVSNTVDLRSRRRVVRQIESGNKLFPQASLLEEFAKFLADVKEDR